METDDPWYAIATKIRTERVRCGLTSSELARRVGVSRATIHNWEGGRPIPIERCATLAEALDVDHHDLLRLHPHVTQEVVAVAEAEAPPVGPSGNRLLLAAAGTIVAIVAASAFAVWHVSSGGCFAVGAGVGSWMQAFQDAYDDLGGSARLGCPVEEARRQGSAIVQELEDGMLIAFEDRGEVFLIDDDILEDYSEVADPASSRIVGTFASDVRVCGEGRIVLLKDGWGESALVEIEGQEGFLWMSPDLWVAYAAVGGPLGPFGLPVVSELERADGAEKATFTGGVIERRYGYAAVLDPGVDVSGAQPFELDDCDPAGLSGP